MPGGVEHQWWQDCIHADLMLPLLPLGVHLQLRWTLPKRVRRILQRMQKHHYSRSRRRSFWSMYMHACIHTCRCFSDDFWHFLGFICWSQKCPRNFCRHCWNSISTFCSTSSVKMAIDVCVILLTISGHMFVTFLAYEVFTQHNIHSFLIDGLSIQCSGSSQLNSEFCFTLVDQNYRIWVLFLVIVVNFSLTFTLLCHVVIALKFR